MSLRATCPRANSSLGVLLRREAGGEAVDRGAHDHGVGDGRFTVGVLRLQAGGIHHDGHERRFAGERVEAHLIPRAAVAEDGSLDRKPSVETHPVRTGGLGSGTV